MTHTVETARYTDSDTLVGTCNTCGKEVTKLHYFDRDDDKMVNSPWRTSDRQVNCETL